MTNFDNVIKATTTAYNSQGSAMKENEAYMESIGAKANMLKAQFEKLVLGDGGLQKFAKTLLDVGTNILKVINAIGGLKTMLVALASVMITLKWQSIVTTLAKFPVLFKTIHTALGNVIISFQRFSGAIGLAQKGYIGFFAVLKASTPIIGAISIAISGLVGWLGHLKKKHEEEEKAMSKAIEKWKESQQEVENLEGTLTSLGDEIARLEAKKVKVTDEQQSQELEKQLNTMKLQEASLENQLRLAKQKAELDHQDAIKKAYKKIEEDGEGIETYDEYGNPQYIGGQGNKVEELEAYNKAYDEYSKKLLEYNNQIKNISDENGNILEKNEQQGKELTNKIEIVDKNMQKLKKAGTDLALELQQAGDTIGGDFSTKINGLVGTFLDVTASEEQANAQYEIAEEDLQRLNEKYGDAENAIRAYLNQHEELNGDRAMAVQALLDECDQYDEYIAKLDEANEKHNEAIESLLGVEQSLSTLRDAMTEYNSTGEFSTKMLGNLLKLDSEYLGLMEFENGQMSINEQAMEKLANAKIDEAEATAYNKAMVQLEQLAHDGLNASLDYGTTASANSQSANQASAQTIQYIIPLIQNGTNAWMQYWNAMENGKGIKNGTLKKEADKIGASLFNEIKALEGVRGNLGKYTQAVESSAGANKGATKAVDEHTEALKRQKKELEDTVKDYEKVIKYIKSKVKDEIDQIKELRDSATKQIEDQIDAIEKQRDTEIDALKKEQEALKEKADKEAEYWDAKINALQEQNDAINDQIELQELQDNLEKARNTKVKVFKDGRFQFDTNQAEVDKARRAVEEFERKQAYEKQLKDLEDFKNKAKANYDQQLKDLEDKEKATKEKYDAQIENLKKLSESTKAEYDAQIEELEKWQKAFEKQVGAYEEEQNRLLALQLTGIDFEDKNWKTRLNNLDSFVAEYRKKQEELAKITEEVNQATENATSSSGSSGGAFSGSYSGTSVAPTQQGGNYSVHEIIGTYSDPQTASKVAMREGGTVRKDGNKYLVYKPIERNLSSSQASAKASSLSRQSSGKKRYLATNRFASGVDKIDEDQVAFVGDDPNKEIVLGSKVNGMAMKLSKGSGVINAQSTKTLAGIINTIGERYSGNNAPLKSDNSSVSNQTFNFGSINLPNVSNADEFVDALSTRFKNYSIQFANQRA